MAGDIKKFVDTFNTSLEIEIKKTTQIKILDSYNNIKKPGVTNPNLYSPGLYYFDVFMSQSLKYDCKPSTYSDIIIGNTVSFGYNQFYDKLLFNTVGDRTTELTSVDIDLTNDDLGGVFLDLRKEYKYSDTTIIYIHYLLYKAFLEAGDTYKSITLPRNKTIDLPIQPQTTQSISSTQSDTPTPEQPSGPIQTAPTPFESYNIVFDVSKFETFIPTSGTFSGKEFYIVSADALVYLTSDDDSTDDYTELNEEYNEGSYIGTEESIFTPGNSEMLIDVEALNLLKTGNAEGDNYVPGNYTIPKNKEQNIRYIIKRMGEKGITNNFTKAAILAIVSKESGFVPQNELSYKGTANREGGPSRIRNIFSVFNKYSDGEVREIANDERRFFDLIYGGRYGNGSNEGYKYRGRGLNQLTFKGNYELYKKKTGHDIVNDPDKVNTIEVATDVLIAFFKSGISSMPKHSRDYYNNSNADINGFKTLNDAVGAIYHCNAGFGRSPESIASGDSTGGRKKSFERAPKFYEMTKQ